MHSPPDDYSRIEKAIHYLDERFPAQPEPGGGCAKASTSARSISSGCSGAGRALSPKRFLQFLMLDYAKHALEQSGNVLDAAYAAGLSSPSRLHDLFVSVEAVTPGEFKKRGDGLRISYGFHPSPFGECLLAVTERGICALYFVTRSAAEGVLDEVRRRWPGAGFVEDPKTTGPYLGRFFPATAARQSCPSICAEPISRSKCGRRCWKFRRAPWFLMRELAARVGNPKASRAVGSAVGQNPIAFIIPCHRVIRKVGAIGNYHGGVTRKRAMLAWEAGRVERQESSVGC